MRTPTVFPFSGHYIPLVGGALPGLVFFEKAPRMAHSTFSTLLPQIYTVFLNDHPFASKYAILGAFV